MTAESSFLAAIVISLLGATFSILARHHENASKVIGCIFGAVAAVCGIASGWLAITQPAQLVSFTTPLWFANLSFLFNPLSGLMIAVISILALAAQIYGLNYFDEYKDGHGLGSAGFFMNLFVAAMLCVIAADNAFWFLVFFELMSLTSYFLVIIEQKKSSVKGGFMYMVMAHLGFFLIMISFFTMYGITGSFEFSSFRATEFSPAIASLVFMFCFIGFGCKAGMIPFHSWLPMAHPEAPSNVSALMSGGMIKIGIFGMIKVGVDLLQSCPVQLWWGIVVLLMGAISSVLGVVYALNEHDIKRLLAYHSVENIGIILLGVGIGFIGMALNSAVLAVIGFVAALYHLFNHAMFKGLLFLGAGSVLHATGTRNMNILGGLAKRMPTTSICFLIGSLAISAVPPLNGFVSEWYTYQSMITAIFTGNPVVEFASAFSIVALAITGALAVACFVKAYGVTFLSTPRSKSAADAHEVGGAMRFSMILLAAICIIAGICAPWVAPIFANISTSLVASPAIPVVAGGASVNPVLSSIMSTPVITIMVIGGVAIAAIIGAIANKGGYGVRKDPWDCGYKPDATMPVIATTFASEVRMFLGPLYNMRDALSSGKQRIISMYQGVVRGSSVVETWGDKYIIDTIARFVEWLSQKVQVLESGDFRRYIIYIVVALIFFICLFVFMVK